MGNLSAVKVTGGGVINLDGKSKKQLDTLITTLRKNIAKNEAHLLKAGWTKDPSGEYAAPKGWSKDSREKTITNAMTARDTKIMADNLVKYEAERATFD